MLVTAKILTRDKYESLVEVERFLGVKQGLRR